MKSKASYNAFFWTLQFLFSGTPTPKTIFCFWVPPKTRNQKNNPCSCRRLVYRRRCGGELPRPLRQSPCIPAVGKQAIPQKSNPLGCPRTHPRAVPGARRTGACHPLTVLGGGKAPNKCLASEVCRRSCGSTVFCDPHRSARVGCVLVNFSAFCDACTFLCFYRNPRFW